MLTSYARSGRMGSRQATTPSQDSWQVPASLGMQTGPCCHLVGTSPVVTRASHCLSEDPIPTLHSTVPPQLLQRWASGPGAAIVYGEDCIKPFSATCATALPPHLLCMTYNTGWRAAELFVNPSCMYCLAAWHMSSSLSCERLNSIV